MGTSDPIQVRDKVYGIRTSVRARGSYKVRIENPVLLLEKWLEIILDFEIRQVLPGILKMKC